MILYIAWALVGISSVGFTAFVTLHLSQKKQNNEMRDRIGGEVEELQLRLNEMEKEQGDLLIKKTEAETRLLAANERLSKAEEEFWVLYRDKESLLEEKNKQIREKELAKQQVTNIEKEMQNWKRTKEQHIEVAKASVLAAGSQLSNKLLDDHKREVQAAKKDNEKVVKETTDELHKKFQHVFESMHNLHEKVNKSTDTVEVVRRSLLSPSGAGSLAEITLANIFKASALSEGRDYQMQYSVKGSEGQGLRPDAVVFLPGNNVMVVDSKASKFFLELGENEQKKYELESGLKRTMNNHLKDLVSRDYNSAISEKFENSHVTVLMFVPTESALEKLREIDSGFMDKAWKENILPVSPTGLVNTLLQAEMLIANAQQEQNSKKIIAEVRDLLGSVAKLHELAGAMGRSLKGAFNKYDEFAGSFNRNFLSKAKRIDKLGASMPKIKEVKQLERYSIGKEIVADAVEDEPLMEIAGE